MNVSLTDKLKDFVNTLVKEGRYQSASEVVREGLRLLEIRESQLKPPKNPEMTERLENLGK